MKIISSLWFTPFNGPPIGIVVGEGEITGDRKAYIGTAAGINEADDQKWIAEYGVPITAQAAEWLLEHLKTPPEDK